MSRSQNRKLSKVELLLLIVLTLIPLVLILGAAAAAMFGGGVRPWMWVLLFAGMTGGVLRTPILRWYLRASR